MTGTITKIKLDLSTLIKPDLAWKVILLNCNCHTFDEVIEQLMKALGCSTATASQLAYTADKFDSVTVFNGSKEDCDRVAYVLENIGLFVKVEQ